MSTGYWQRTITNDAGDIIANASVEVREPSADFTGSLVSLVDIDGAGLSNPFNADSEGFARFGTSPQLVDIRATGSGSQRTWRKVAINGTAAVADTTTGPSDKTGVARAEDLSNNASWNWHDGNLDIEEGTWTPDLQDDSGNSASISTESCNYLKVGSQVTLTGRIFSINTTGLSSTDKIVIKNAPFSSKYSFHGAAIPEFGGINVDAVLSTALQVSIRFDGTTSDIILNVIDGAGSQFPALPVSAINSGSGDIRFTITYITNA